MSTSFSTTAFDLCTEPLFDMLTSEQIERIASFRADTAFLALSASPAGIFSAPYSHSRFPEVPLVILMGV